MAPKDVETLQAKFGDEDWKRLLSLYPEWLKDLSGLSKEELSTRFREEFSAKDADVYASDVVDFFEQRNKKAKSSATTNASTDATAAGFAKSLEEKTGIVLGAAVDGYPDILQAQDKNGASVVVKRLHGKQEVDRARQVMELKVPNSLAYTDVLEVGDSHVAVMPYVERTLEQAASSLSSESIDRGTRCIMKALESLHKSGFVHMDVKASNIYVDGKADGKWLLGDFGSVTKIGGDPSSCTDRYLPQGVSVEAQPQVDFEMLQTMLALLIAASSGKDTEGMDGADKTLGYRPMAQVRDDMLQQGDAQLKAVTKSLAEKAG